MILNVFKKCKSLIQKKNFKVQNFLPKHLFFFNFKNNSNKWQRKQTKEASKVY